MVTPSWAGYKCTRAQGKGPVLWPMVEFRGKISFLTDLFNLLLRGNVVWLCESMPGANHCCLNGQLLGIGL